MRFIIYLYVSLFVQSIIYDMLTSLQRQNHYHSNIFRSQYGTIPSNTDQNLH